MFKAVALLGALTMAFAADTCTNSCPGQTMCTALANTTSSVHTSWVPAGLVCNADNDAILASLFSSLGKCKLADASIEVAELFGIDWDGVGSIEALIDNEDFWLDTCEWEHLSAAACLYYNMPAEETCTDSPLKQSSLFCPDECMKIANGCLNLKKYRNLKTSITDLCADVSAASPTETCYKTQFSQEGASAPDCKEATPTSLTGPYIIGGISLALAVVALIGLALVTCRTGAGGGSPNSF